MISHREGRVAVIELARPDRGNAMTLRLCTELVDALDEADHDDEVGAIVLTGRGRHFCLGADLSEGFHHGGREPSPEHAAYVARFGTIGGVPRDVGGVVTLRMAALRTPLVVAVNGCAVGGGASMLLPADVRIVAHGARIGFVFGRRGMAAESASSWFLPRIVGMTRALDWVLSGRLLTADELLAGGLATALAPDDAVLDAAMTAANQIVEHTSTVATSLSRQLLWSMLSAPSPWDAHEIESQGVFDLPGREDVREGVRSFLDKRDPQFPMRVPRDYPGYGPRWPGEGPAGQPLA
ncbi:enoyl-CoA hydratase/isomerase family protein [Nocardioides sp. TRM66260-LWL]|uniref:enoyl-CoA hydratase-related protein n=1 Tax=Nocardioides sp. TRM66260-LWL TaxID=2874478 RepID=UPI001CC7A0B0|nr:enoyl-CoA hydratase-related protein [Nocardioides sp. TRM66260-LWL]MBZ5735329.1 enoyl-CoA hydratase/isomerase family protein [Nocardioides sp. TRM66260-LWL]